MLYCLEVLLRNKPRIGVAPPNDQPKDNSSEGFNPYVHSQAKPHPLVVLIKSPHVMKPSSDEDPSSNFTGLARQNTSRVYNLVVVQYQLPVFTMKRERKQRI